MEIIRFKCVLASFQPNFSTLKNYIPLFGNTRFEESKNRERKGRKIPNKNGTPIIPSVIFFRKIEEILDSMIKIRQFIDSYTISRVTKLDSRDSPFEKPCGEPLCSPLPPSSQRQEIFISPSSAPTA